MRISTPLASVGGAARPHRRRKPGSSTIAACAAQASTSPQPALPESGFVRISCNPRYPNPLQTPDQAIALLAALHQDARHRYGSETPSVVDSPFASLLVSRKDTTDRYLLRQSQADAPSASATIASLTNALGASMGTLPA